jgi:hypothetical protein
VDRDMSVCSPSTPNRPSIVARPLPPQPITHAAHLHFRRYILSWEHWSEKGRWACAGTFLKAADGPASFQQVSFPSSQDISLWETEVHKDRELCRLCMTHHSFFSFSVMDYTPDQRLIEVVC